MEIDEEIDEEMGNLQGRLTALENSQNRIRCLLVATIGAVVLLMFVNAFKLKT